MRRLFGFLHVALFGASLAAFADAGHQAIGRPGDQAKTDRIVEVVANEYRFTPARVAVKRGETIRFVVRNEGKLAHEMVLGSMAELKEHAALMRKFPNMEHDEPNQVRVAPGKTGQIVWQFTRSGEVDFACLIPGHMEAGMLGEVDVKKAPR
jgi:uncharacterized cupredoxin-like copper-binding protein